MKQLKPLVLVLLLISSCKKNDLQPTVISNATVYTKPTTILPTHILAITSQAYTIPAMYQTEFGTVAQKITYDNQNSVRYLMTSKTTPGKYFMTTIVNSLKYFSIYRTTFGAEGINTLTESSTYGTPYYSIQYNQLGGISNLSIINVPPWGWKYDPVGRQTFNQCMQLHYDLCFKKWDCGFTCGLAMIACLSGMSIACSGRIVCPACYSYNLNYKLYDNNQSLKNVSYYPFNRSLSRLGLRMEHLLLN